MKDKQEHKIIAPFAGEVVPVTAVPDPVFSEGMLGIGFAVIPSGDKCDIIAPASGKISAIADTLHAINIECEDGTELLIHIGIDSFSLSGKGFTPAVKAGEYVSCGDRIMTVDMNTVRNSGRPTITPIIITNPEHIKEPKLYAGLKCAGDVALCYELRA